MLPEFDFKGAVTKHLQDQLSVVSISPVGDGFHATGFDVLLTNGNHLFLRQIHPVEFGHDLPGDRVKAMLETAYALPSSLKTIAILGITAEGNTVNIANLREVLTLGEFFPENTKSFCEDLRTETASIKESRALAERIRTKAIRMGVTMASIHERHFDGPQEHASSLYKRSTRAVIHNDELTSGVGDLIDFHASNWLTHAQYVRLLENMEEVRYALGIHPERLRQIHGDFWANNLYFDAQQNIIITDGRLNWGEPGIDAGWMVGEFAMQDLIRFGHFGDAFTDVADTALAYYVGLTDDTEIYRYMSLPYAFQAFAEAVFTPTLTSVQRRTLFATAVGTLQEARNGRPFDLKRLNTYTSRGRDVLDAVE